DSWYCWLECPQRTATHMQACHDVGVSYATLLRWVSLRSTPPTRSRTRPHSLHIAFTSSPRRRPRLDGPRLRRGARRIGHHQPSLLDSTLSYWQADLRDVDNIPAGLREDSSG